MVLFKSTTVLMLVLASLAILHIVRCIWRRRWLLYYASKIKGPFIFPVTKSASPFLKRKDVLYSLLSELVNKYKSLFKVWMGINLFIVVTDPHYIETILNNFLDKSFVYELNKSFVGNGLITAPVELWRKHRKIINVTFGPKILNSYFHIFLKNANFIVKKLEVNCKGNFIDLYPIFCQYSFSNVCETLMGVEPSVLSEESHLYISWMMRLQHLATCRFFSLWLQPEFLWNLTSLSKEFKMLIEKAWNFVRKLVLKKKLEKNIDAKCIENIIDGRDNRVVINVCSPSYFKGNANKKMFLDYLIELTEKYEKWSDEELMEETQTMVIAATETTANLQSYVMLMLAMHQDIQNQVYEEIVSILNSSNRDITLDDLNRMMYLEQVIKETLRMFPVVAIILRQLHTNIKLDTHILPAGASVVIPIIEIHRNPDIWPNPLKFNPNRFLSEEISKRPRCSFIPFSTGPRNCIGIRYAMMSTKILISSLIKHYRIRSSTYSSVSDVKFETNVLLKPLGGHKVILEKRFSLN